jgi:hypothetical protein
MIVATRSLRPSPAIMALLAAAGICTALALVVPAAASASGRFFVPTGKRSGFGPFQESADSVAALRRAFGPPASEEVDEEYRSCIQRWPQLGISVTLVSFGEVADACGSGTFYSARLTDPRWHTATGVHPGGPRSAARRAALRRCGARSCGATGYALEMHHTDCALTRSAGVIAHVRGRMVVSLIVDWRGCE